MGKIRFVSMLRGFDIYSVELVVKKKIHVEYFIRHADDDFEGDTFPSVEAAEQAIYNKIESDLT